ncbi:hypothetical protein [Streptomyces sp. NPDC001480]|uniref:hypothetical protein n=1 Tax=Streptomyces sp. NPDC001480 TaxID=3364577 RepID=UPI0036B258BC
MLTAPTFRSVEGAYIGLLQLATEEPERRIDARGNAAHEVIGVSFRLSDPRQRLPFLANARSIRSSSSPKRSGISAAAATWR